MINVPFYDFDEAHRAENAKRMAEYRSYFVPLTGSSFDRVGHLKIPLKENPDLHLYYHLERPPLIYLLMVISTSIFGSYELAFRLPSFLMGILTLLTFILFARREKGNAFAISVGFLCLLTSMDLWLSSQYAQMDTGITFFLTLSLLTIIYSCESKKKIYFYISGCFFGLGLLSKLQPAIIFIFPIIGLLILKKISKSELIRFLVGFLITFLPWVIYLIAKFGIKDVIQIMSGFALTSASIIDIHHKAPIFWYIRWWWESLRPGWTLLLAFIFYDSVSHNLDWKKKTLLMYLFGGLLAFSLPINKIWWYILPLIPAGCFYVFLSINDYLQKEQKSIENLSFAIIVASLPLFIQSSNTVSMIYGILITMLVIQILKNKISIKINLGLGKNIVFFVSIILSLLLFLYRFPKIIPYHINTKEVSLFYKNLPNPKCLWLGDMPGEAALFYSNSGEIPLLNETSQIFTSCKNNFLITPNRYRTGRLLIRKGNMRLYQLTEDYKKLSE